MPVQQSSRTSASRCRATNKKTMLFYQYHQQFGRAACTAWIVLTMRSAFRPKVPLPAHMNAALCIGLNSEPPNMSHIGPMAMIAVQMTVTVRANSPMPLMPARASAACSAASN